MRFSLADLAARIGAELAGDPGREVGAIRTLELAGPDDLSFVTSPRFVEVARASKAGAFLVGPKTPELPADRLVVRDPSQALATLIELFHPAAPRRPGIHPTAVVDPEATVDPSAEVGPFAVVDRGARIGADAAVGAHAVIGAGSSVGAGATIHPHVVLYPGVAVGAGSIVHSGTVLGADGFGYASGPAGHRKIPQVGTVELGAEVEIGALTAVDRALLGVTRIGDGTKIDNLVQVGHNVEVGRHSILCGQVGIAGSTRIGDGVVFGGRAGAGDHSTVGDRVQVASVSVVYGEVEAGAVVAGMPAVPIQRWRRQQALLLRLEPIWRRLRAMERKLGLGGGEESPAADGAGQAEEPE